MKKAKKTEKKTVVSQPVTAGRLAQGQLMTLALEKVLPTKDNQRAIDPKSADIAELAESLKTAGQVVPVNVRPHPTKKGFYELRAGERRLVAAKVAGLKTIQAIVQDLDDVAAKGVTVIENLQRADLKPLEEGAAVADLVATGQSLREIAAKIGKSHQWVARRARLTTLIPEWKKRFEEYQTPATAMELIARFDAVEQEHLLKSVQVYGLQNPGTAARSIANRLQEELLELAKRPWKGLGSLDVCFDCPHRSGARGELFDGPDKCLSRPCYEATLEKFLEAQATKLKAEHPNLVKVNKESYSPGGGMLGSYDFQDSKPNGKDAVPALIVQGPGTGTLTWIRKTGGYGNDPKPTGPKTMKQKRDELESKRWAETVNRFARDLDKMPIEKLERPEVAVELAAIFGTYHQIMVGDLKDFEALAKLPEKERALKAATTLWAAVRQVIADRIEYLGPVTQYEWQGKTAEAQKVANLVNVTLRDVYAQVCLEKGFTEPKSWTGHQNEAHGARQATEAAG